MSDSISEQCQQIRMQIRHARKSLSANQQLLASKQLFKRLCEHPKIQQAQKLSLTLPFDGEIDLTLFIDWCWQQGKLVYLPVVDPEQQGKLLFVAYQADTIMFNNRYGILEPKLFKENQQSIHYSNTVPANTLDIVLTPLVAFDSQGQRIGMGGGYYDRLLSPWYKGKTGPYPIGVAHNCQYQAQIPTQPWDVPLPEILTPEKHFIF